MSDFRAKFRAAAAERSTIPTKEQLKALRAQKQAAASGHVQGSTAAAPGPSSLQQRPAQQQQPAARPAGAAGLPADFFQPAAQPSSSGRPAATVASAPSVPAPPPQQQQRAGAPGQPTPAVPEGFFADKAADAKARGVKLPDAADKEAEFKEFAAMIEDQLKQQAAEEAEQAEEDALEKEEREAFRQKLLDDRLEMLRQRKARMAGTDGGTDALPQLPGREQLAEELNPFGAASGAGAGSSSGDAGQTNRLQLPQKRRRVIDVLAETLGAAGDGDSDGDEDDDAAVLDWRAKKL